jgi:acetyl esterase/lipase
MRALAPLLAAVCCLTLAAPAAAAGPSAPCTGDPSVLHRLDLTVGGTPTYGNYALPRARPRGLVVFGHGYSYNVDAWRQHMIDAATRDGLVAVTMDYRGLTDLPRDATGYERSRGFPVKAGGEDLVAAAQHLQQVCGGFDRRILLGVSLGGNTTGLALAQRAKTADGRPLFDYWVGVEGLYNFTETYNEARAAGATAAQQDIEKEAGGTFEQQPAAYAERTVLNRADDIAGAGLKGIVLVHGVNDGMVPYNQAQEMARRLRQAGVPTDLYTAVRKAPGDQADDSRLAPTDVPGHASEWAKHVVIDTGLDRVSALATRAEPPPCNRDFQVDGTATPTTSPDPATPGAGCPAKPAFSGSAAGGSGGGAGGGTAPGGTPCPAVIQEPTLSDLKVRRTRRGGLTIRGRARAQDCAPGGGLARVRVAVARLEGKRCRLVTGIVTGRLSRPRSCTRNRIFLRPRGKATFVLAVRHLRPGRYRVTAVATDADARRVVTRSVRIR